MEAQEQKFEEIGLAVPKILMPKEGTDMTKWSVIACDQYTSEPEYWKSVEEYVGSAPSTLNLIFPEVYLDEPDFEERIQSIGNAMQDYLDKGILKEHEPSFFLVKRSSPESPARWGLIAALDLEQYDYSKGSTTPIRATEGTIEERIPPRKKIREKAPIELPHILVLIDDDKKSVIEPQKEKIKGFEKVYDFDLMKDGGHVTGYKITDEESVEQIRNALEKLADPKSFKEKHGTENVLLYAMGDGNHSFATAKAVWEDIKQKNAGSKEIMNHPARWALVEIENLFDEALVFEPIHRVVFNGNIDDYIGELEKESKIEKQEMSSLEEINALVRKHYVNSKEHYIGYVTADSKGVLIVKSPKSTIAAGTAQNAISSYIEKHTDASVDYIHGEESTETLGSKSGNFGLILPPLNKHDFFKTVVHDGALPRKTFSMGEAHEKRYYIEARRITE